MIQSVKSVHFLGVCGTAMGSVAVGMRDAGYRVSGTDAQMYPPMSDFLRERGIDLSEGYSENCIPEDVDLVVIGNALSRGNPAVETVLNRKLPFLSLPETLKFFFLRGKHNLVVTGTHGKTTTTSLLAWIFECAGKRPSFLIGGIPNDLKQGCRLQDSPFFLLEGDEYDTAFFDKRSKFLHYLPELVIVNNIEFDHADIFRDLAEIKLSFRRLLNLVPSEGMILLNGDDPNCTDAASGAPAPIVEVGFSANCGNQIRNVLFRETESEFTLFGQKFCLPMLGEFNVRNAAMAVSAAHFYGIPLGGIRDAVAAFSGVKRRQEVRGVVRGVTVIDDFGHHPTAIRQTLAGLRVRFPQAKIWALFEPRSNTTRRAVFQNALPEALSLADGVMLSKVARLEQLDEQDRLDPVRVVADLRALGIDARYEPGAREIVSALTPLLSSGDLVVVFSNGGFEGIHQLLLDALKIEHPTA